MRNKYNSNRNQPICLTKRYQKIKRKGHALGSFKKSKNLVKKYKGIVIY